MDIKNTNSKEDKEIEIIPNAMFPFCAYNNDYSEGVLVKEYDERFCNSFQVNTYPHLNHLKFRLLFIIQNIFSDILNDEIISSNYRLRSMSMECAIHSTTILKQWRRIQIL